MRIRSCNSADAETLSLLGSATLLEAFAGLIPGEAILAHCRMNHTIAAWQQHLAAPTSHAWLAQIPPGDFPIGYALVTLPDFPAPLLQTGDLELKRLYSFSRFHGPGGPGRALMQQAIASARELGARRLLLGVHPDNARAIAFYRRTGFLQIGTRPFHLGPETFDDPVFALAL